MKSILLLCIICLTSTFFVSGQTYKTSNDAALLIKTSSTTWTLKYENTSGGVTTKYLTFYNGPKTTDDKLDDKIFGYLGLPPGKKYKVKSSSDSVTIQQDVNSLSVKYYNELGRLLWSISVYEI